MKFYFGADESGRIKASERAVLWPSLAAELSEAGVLVVSVAGTAHTVAAAVRFARLISWGANLLEAFEAIPPADRRVALACYADAVNREREVMLPEVDGRLAEARRALLRIEQEHWETSAAPRTIAAEALERIGNR